MAELLNQERISPKFLSGDVTYKKYFHSLAYLYDRQMIASYLLYVLENVVKLLKLSQTRSFLLGKKNNNTFIP